MHFVYCSWEQEVIGFFYAISCYEFFKKCVKLLLKLRRSIAKLMLKDHVSGICVLEHKTRICTDQKLSGSKLDFFLEN